MNHKRTFRLLVGTAIFAALSLIFVTQGISARFESIQAVHSLTGNETEGEGPDSDGAVRLAEVTEPEKLLAQIDCPADTVSFDGSVSCDLNGDGITEDVTFFTGRNETGFYQGLIPDGWDLAAYAEMEGKPYQIWFNIVGSVRSAGLDTLENGQEVLHVVCSSNVGTEEFQLRFEHDQLKLFSLTGGLAVERGIPERAVSMIIRHFDAMAKGDAAAFQATLFPEDGADANGEPHTLETFNKFKDTEIFVKEIRIGEGWSFLGADGEPAKSAVLDIVLWRPTDRQSVLIKAGISQQSEEWGIGRYY